MKGEQESCTARQSQTYGTATSAKRAAELQSWIDNVIVPILVQEILKTRRTVEEDSDAASTKSETSCADPD
jgi:hypothetical protein